MGNKESNLSRESNFENKNIRTIQVNYGLNTDYYSSGKNDPRVNNSDLCANTNIKTHLAKHEIDYEKILVLISVYFKGNEVYKNTLPALSSIKTLIDDIYKSISQNNNLNELNQWVADEHKFKNVKVLYKDKNLLNFPQLFIKDFLIVEQMTPELIINFHLAGLDLWPQNNNNDYVKFIATIDKKGEGIYIYHIENNKIKFESKYNEDLNINKENIAHCNGMNNLFLSGNNLHKDFNFVIINLESFEETLKFNSLDKNRFSNNNINSHSIIFVPDKYICLVGGKSKNVEIFDFDSKKFYNHSKLNQELVNPQLALTNNSYLYAISGSLNLTAKFGDTGLRSEINYFIFERINLKFITDEWELISIKLEEDVKIGRILSVIYSIKRSEIIILNQGSNFNIMLLENESITNPVNEFTHNFLDQKGIPSTELNFIPINSYECFAFSNLNDNSNLKIYKYDYNKTCLNES